MKTFKIRASALGKIMAGEVGASPSQLAKIAELEARDKPMTDNMKAEYARCIWSRDNPELPRGAKSYVESWLKEQLYGQRAEAWSKPMQKGIECEGLAITLLGLRYNLDLEKNVNTYESEHLTGTPDLILPDCVRDIKTMWDFSTMPIFDKEIEDRDYWWQLQAYMILANKPRAMLDYCLVETPEYLDSRKLNYDNVPIELTVKTFEVERDDSVFDKIAERVDLCRKYVLELLGGMG